MNGLPEGCPTNALLDQSRGRLNPRFLPRARRLKNPWPATPKIPRARGFRAVRAIGETCAGPPLHRRSMTAAGCQHDGIGGRWTAPSPAVSGAIEYLAHEHELLETSWRAERSHQGSSDGISRQCGLRCRASRHFVGEVVGKRSGDVVCDIGPVAFESTAKPWRSWTRLGGSRRRHRNPARGSRRLSSLLSRSHNNRLRQPCRGLRLNLTRGELLRRWIPPAARPHQKLLDLESQVTRPFSCGRPGRTGRRPRRLHLLPSGLPRSLAEQVQDLGDNPDQHEHNWQKTLSQSSPAATRTISVGRIGRTPFCSRGSQFTAGDGAEIVPPAIERRMSVSAWRFRSR